MGKEITEDELHQLTYKTIDELYEVYEVTHSFTMCLYLRFNGDAEHPGELLTKEDFYGYVLMVVNGPQHMMHYFNTL